MWLSSFIRAALLLQFLTHHRWSILGNKQNRGQRLHSVWPREWHGRSWKNPWRLWDNGKVAGCAIAGLEPAVKGSPAKTIKLPAALSGSHNLKGKYFSPHITTWWTKWLPNVQKEHSFWKCGMWVPEMQQQPQGTHHSCYLRPPLPDYLLSKGFIFRSFTRYFRSSSRKGRLKKNKNTKSRTYWFLRIPPEFVCLFWIFCLFIWFCCGIIWAYDEIVVDWFLSFKTQHNASHPSG